MYMLINGEKKPASNQETIDVINPATDKVVGQVPAATKEDVAKAIWHAKNGKRKWRQTPLYERCKILRNFSEILDERGDQLAELVSKESGKTLRSCKDEVMSCINVFQSYAEKARNLNGEVMARDTEPRVYGDIIFNYREPLGVVVTIVPYNYPIELFAHKVAPALVMGNTVIVKPASETPLGNILMVEWLLEAGVPNEAIQIVTGHGVEVGKQLTLSPDVALISLTGSTRAGIEVSKEAANNLSHVLLELGGNDPFIIFADADVTEAVEETIEARASNAGQTCCGSKRFIVQRSIKEEYEQKLIERLKKIKVGDPLDEATFYGPLVSEKAAKDVENQIEWTLSQGAKLLYGGHRFNKTFIEPTVLTDVTGAMDVAKDLEIFGPVFPIIGFDTVEEAIALANASCYGLSSGVLTKSMDTAMKVANEIESGTCVIGGSGNYRSTHMPFGGQKLSGIGREGVSETLLEYTQIKNIALKGFGNH